MAVSFKKAERKKVWAKILLNGPSGSGKSYSALRLASGLAKKCNSRIAYIGTEGSRDSYYCTSNDGDDGLFDYDLISLDAPFSIDKYVEAIDAAVDAGYQVLIIDTLSSEWKWLNDKHDAMPGNSWQNWGRLKPQHRAFMDKILLSPIHVIGTTRSKADWVIEEKNGKQSPKKVGLAAIQDSEISYDYTVSFVIDQTNHVAVADKDNTKLFSDRYEVLTEKDGEAIWNWCNVGSVKEDVKPVASTIMNAASLPDIKSKIISKCGELGGTKNSELMKVLAKYSKNCNPNAIKTVEEAQKCLDEIGTLEN